MSEGDSAGFTLVELMVVVAIVGVLATLAVVGYRKLVRSSHVSEATGMVSNIRVAQEAYHAETQQYAGIDAQLTNFYPQATPSYNVITSWGGTCSNCATGMDWSQLPLHVDGPVLFGYATTAGVAGSAPNPTSVTVNGKTINFPPASPVDWYVIGARADLDGDPSNYTEVFGTVWSNQILVSNEGL